MKKVLYIRKPEICGKHGIGRYCQALYDMFLGHEKIYPCAIKDIPTIKSLFFHIYFKIRPLFKAIKDVDVVHINGYTDMGTVEAFVVSKILGKKIVYTAHWHPFSRLAHPVGGKIFFCMFIKPLVSRFADKVICINNEDTAYFSKFCKSVVTIPHWFVPNKSIIDVHKKKNMILFVGRINDHVKGINHLFALPEGKYDIHCVGFGDFSFKRNDMVHHVNISDEELARLYSQASLLVIPSQYEAFSYVALEAFSYGTPVVMSERVRIADYLGNKKGYSIFKYGDMKDFVNKVELTIGEDVDVESIIKVFDYHHIKQMYESVYLS